MTAPYSRVYWSVMDDDKFDGIREDARLLGSWTLLLIVADMAHPAPAFLPPTVSRTSVQRLVDAGLVDLLDGHRYRLHGLAAERGRRSEAASVGGRASGRSRGKERTLNERSQAPGTESNLDETSRDETETSRDETSTRDDFDALDVYHELTGYRPWGEWSGDALKGAITDYGDATVQAAMRTEYAASGDRNDLLKRVQARLARDADKAKQARAETPRRLRPVVSDKDRLAAIEEIRANAKEGA